MKYLIPTLVALVALALFAPAVSEAGPIRNLLRRGKGAAGAVVRHAAHPFGGSKGGSCGG